MTKTALYRHYDAEGALLYVGISANPEKRTGEHAGGSGWAGEIEIVQIEWFDTKREALSAETAAILREKPIHNVMTAKSKGDDCEIASRVKWVRAMSGLTQAEFSKQLGFKRSRFSLWEAGRQRISLDGALALKKKCGVSLDWIFCGDNPPEAMTEAPHDT